MKILKYFIFACFLLVFSGCAYIDGFLGTVGLKSQPKQQHKITQAPPKKPTLKPTILESASSKSTVINTAQPASKAIKSKPDGKKDEIDYSKILPFKRIAFVGDSHIAGDFISQRFRKKLHINSLGFIPPILPKYHRQALANYQSQGTSVRYLINHKEVDFSGISAFCQQPCEIDIKLAFKAHFPVVVINNRFINLAANDHLHISAAAGDNIAGVLSNNASFVDNLGINGASVFNYQRIKKSNFAPLLNYDLVIFSFGTNESVAASVNIEALSEKMLKIFARFKDAKKLLLLPPEPVLYKGGKYQLGASTDEVFTTLKAAAKQAGASVFDIRELERSEGGRSAWQERKLALMNTHLSPRGYYYVADKLLEYLANE